jgi:BASS family bile acid:Na+ symporter
MRQIDVLGEWLHRRFLWFILAAYGLAATLPGAALQIRTLGPGNSSWRGHTGTVTVPAMLLAVLLFNAGLGFRADHLRHILYRPALLLGGLAANLASPALFLLGVSLTLPFWHNPAEMQSILVGLAIIASMPIAGSSTAWAQNANGDMVLSLGLVILSTCLSPLTTPAVLQLAGRAANGAYAEALATLASQKTSIFLLAFVMIPSLAGIAVRSLCPQRLLTVSGGVRKLTNMTIVLVLCYCNAATALPRAVAEPDWDFLACILCLVTFMCVQGFIAGWGVARAFRADRAGQASLVFGLGMTNNGTGLVIAASALSHLPAAVLPVIFYNLIQHIVAAVTDHLGRGSTLSQQT